jgi:hypothetical protein
MDMSFEHDAERDLTRKRRRELAREERRATEAAARKSASARRRISVLGGAVMVIAAVTSVVVLATAGGGEVAVGQQSVSSSRPQLVPLASFGALASPGPAGAPGPEGVPIPNAAPAAEMASKAAGEPVDGIECSSSEQTLFHVHAHLTIFVSGAARQVPYGIGIPDARIESTPAGAFVGAGSCFYWLHTHAADGIIHIESPVSRTFTLGEFFDIWAQPLSSNRVGLSAGRVTAIYDGQLYVGDPRAIPLNAHAQIQLEVGSPLVAPDVISFPAGL